MRLCVPVLLTVLALATAQIGCQSKSGAPGGPAAVEGVTWRLAELDGRPAEPLPKDTRAPGFRLDATDKRVSGYGGVNQMSGSYALNGKALKFGMLATTRRAGPEPLMRQESALTRVMEKTDSWRSAGPDDIELLDAAGKPLARFKAAR